MQRDVVLICGQTGSGKSTYARSVVAGLARAIILDAGFREFEAVHLDSLDDLLSSVESRRGLDDLEAPFRVSYTPLTDEYNLCFRLASAVGNVTLVLEEADRFAERDLPAYEEIIARGRHRGVSILAIAPHPYNFPKNLRRQLTRVVSFRQVEESDLDYLADAVGDEIYCVRDFAPGSFTRYEWTAPGPGKII